MATPAVLVNFAMFKGEDKLLQDTIYQSDGTTVQNITGWSMSFIVHAYGNPDTVFITKTTGGGGIALTSPTTGVLTITVDSADTEDLNPDQYEFAIRRTDSGNNAVVTRGLYTLQSA